jgi:hypothetical protein
MKAYSPTLTAILLLKKLGIIDKPKEVTYLGRHGGDHVFSTSAKDILTVDLVLSTVRLNDKIYRL